MNKCGKEYIDKVNKDISTFLKENSGIIIPKYKFQDSLVQERIMRMGREQRIFELNVNDYNELELMATTTLKEDFIKNYKKK